MSTTESSMATTDINQKWTFSSAVDCAEFLHNMSLSVDLNVTTIKKDMYAVAVPMIIVICILVMLANGAILFTARAIKSSAKEHPTLPLTFSLAASDLWTSVAMAFSLVYNSYLFIVFGIESNACVSLAFEAVRMGGFITGSLHLLALAVIHYLTIRCPTSYQNVVTFKTNWAVIFCIWIFPPLALLIFKSSLPGQFFRSTYDPCRGYCMNYDLWRTFEFRLVIFFAFFSPFIIMSALYVMFLVLFRRREKKFRRIPPSSGGLRYSCIMKSKCQRQQLQKSRRTFITTIMIWLTFFLGWIPSCALFILTCETCPFPQPVETVYNVRAMFILGVIGNIFILCKSLINPIIYAIRIPEIKAALQEQYSWCPLGFTRSHQRENISKDNNHQESSADEQENGGDFNNVPKKTKPPESGNARKKEEIEIQSPQEHNHLLKNNGVDNVDCEMYANQEALARL